MRKDICTVDDVRDFFLGPPHGTAPTADTTKRAPLTAAKHLKERGMAYRSVSFYENEDFHMMVLISGIHN